MRVFDEKMNHIVAGPVLRNCGAVGIGDSAKPEQASKANLRGLGYGG
jgi:hypothetical protein